MFEQIKAESKACIEEYLAAAQLNAGDLFVVGCSTSEVLGGEIGKAGSLETATAIFDGLYPALNTHRVHLAVQCCEHLNRALVLERAVLKSAGYTEVAAIPHPKAGGAFAHVAWNQMRDPCLAESITAQGGLDIGGTLIGMHLAVVAVPLRLRVKTIGNAPVLCAKTRPKFIGGTRAIYEL